MCLTGCVGNERGQNNRKNHISKIIVPILVFFISGMELGVCSFNNC